MTETPQSVARKQAHYLQIMNKARQADDPVLVKMVLRKLAALFLLSVYSFQSTWLP